MQEAGLGIPSEQFVLLVQNLGADLNVGKQVLLTTTKERVLESIPPVRRIGALRLSRDLTVKLVASDVTPRYTVSAYCIALPVQEQVTLRAAITQATWGRLGKFTRSVLEFVHLQSFWV